MNQALVDQVVQAVLYEGYILYPYRASARKNRQRFTFGRIYPEDYSIAEGGAEPCRMQTECLIEGDARLNITVRFLHPMARDIAELSTPARDLPAREDWRLVPSLEIDGELHTSWQEAVERAVPIKGLSFRDLAAGSEDVPFFFPASREIEPLRDREGMIRGVVIRRQEAVAGTVRISAKRIDEKVSQWLISILNRTKMEPAALRDSNEVVMRTFASTHTILVAEQGAFISLLEPPPAYADAARACQNVGTWPILVGDEARQERDAMISSPIILYDYPKIAPESPGDLFDAGEIDEILTLRIMTMTDEEKREMRQVDAQARRILERTEALPQGDLLRMHGVMRKSDELGEGFFNPSSRARSVSLSGVELREGDRVRVRPKSRADVMDIAIAGRVAIIESIEQDAEEKFHLALVMEDDPGRDLGLLRQPGHRFFYGLDEVELVEAAT